MAKPEKNLSLNLVSVQTEDPGLEDLKVRKQERMPRAQMLCHNTGAMKLVAG